jgi:hypothetical protein
MVIWDPTWHESSVIPKGSEVKLQIYPMIIPFDHVLAAVTMRLSSAKKHSHIPGHPCQLKSA